ncbi:MAG: T9SS type A sorting domain-containing protein [Sphingobacteriales bacterium]|nr:T9SS type A sorting domain-containing protein [Sphingobacteriales bacterium]
MISTSLLKRENFMYLAVVSLLMISTGCYTKKENSKRKFFSLPEGKELKKEGGRKRQEYELKLLRDPKTGLIPVGIREKELALFKTLPAKTDINYRGQVNNTYTAVGPTQNGGRTRAVMFDMRYNGTSNKVIMAGGINGGIFRSVDGGSTWGFVSPENEIHSVSCFAQDPRPGFQDIWYAGTGGEVVGASAADPSSFYVPGFGIFKSTDNGVTWARLNSTSTGAQTPPLPSSLLDNNFDMVYRMLVHPATGNVYAAINNNIMRSVDGGTTWSAVLSPSISGNIFGGMTELTINADGSRLFAAFSGRASDRNIAGVFTSTTGNSGSWTRIAGGVNGSADSVAGWKAYNNATSLGEYTSGWGRVVLATAPSNSNILYVLYYNNSQDVSSGIPEADLFKADLTAFPTITWSNNSANLIAKQDGITNDAFDTQGEYNMCLAVHPDNPSLVIAGGVNLFRSSDGFATKTNVTFIGGYESTTFSDPNFASHPDHHFLAFDPSAHNRLVVASDGGLYATNNVTLTKPSWNLFNSQYQTFQYYHISIDPEIGSQAFAGGAQDNSTTFRDINGILGAPLPDPNDHYIIIGGDGGATGYSKKDGLGQQYLYASAQLGNIYRLTLFSPFTLTDIKPTGSTEGQFVTYFHLDEDNTEFLYFVIDNILYRTTSASTVTPDSWEEVTGVEAQLTGSIYSMATTRGTYTANSYLFMGTDDGKVYRLKNPSAVVASTLPTNITPSGMTAGSVVTDIAVNPRNQDTVMCVASNYGVKSIFWTGNATAATPTWQSIEGNISLPSIRTCAIVTKTTGVEYYVGTSIGLYSTTTINSTATIWTNEGSGMLKTSVVNDLAYRWQDNTLLIGTHGNGMFVTQIGNAVTSIGNVIRNDKNFIKAAYPTLASSQLLFQTGGLTTIKKIQVEILTVNGQLVYKESYPYRDGSIPVSRLANGNYIINISSDNRKYLFTQKFVKIN